jgi:hypothetical protein
LENPANPFVLEAPDYSMVWEVLEDQEDQEVLEDQGVPVL